MTKTNQANNQREIFTPLKRFYSLLNLDRKDITYIYVYAIFAGLITLTIPLGIQAIIGLIAGGTMSTSLYILIAVVTIGTALTGILKIMQLTVTETLQRRIFTRSSFEFAYRIPHFKLESMRSQYPPELVNRFFDTQILQKGLPKVLMDFSTAVLQILFGLILISFYHPFFVFFGLLLIIIVLAIFRFTGPAGLTTSLQESNYKYAVAHWLEELARATNSFKLSGGNRLYLHKTDDLVVKYLDVRKKHFRILLTQFGSVVGFKVVITAALLLLGSLLVVNNQINIGQFVAAEIVVLLIMNSVEKLILNMETIYDMLTAIEKIGTVADQDLDRKDGARFETIDTGKGMSIDLQNVTFQFEDDDRPTLDNLTLSIKSNEKICIAGYNRAGKSTLIHLISAFYGDYQGSISYNGLPAQNIELNSLHKNIGEFTTQLDIFRGTVYDNIRLQQEKLTIAEMIEITKAIHLHDYLQKLPMGYETVLLPGGRNLPGSIRSKIILARAIAAQPRLFVMEDTFHQLENTDREAMLRFLTDKKRNWTMVVISDDPVLAAKCDRVIIMNQGKVIDQGTLKSLTKKPYFQEVFKMSPVLAKS